MSNLQLQRRSSQKSSTSRGMEVMSQLPIITAGEVKPPKLPIQIYSVVMRWVDKKFIDLETGKEVNGKLWKFVGLNRLSCFNNGRWRLDKSKPYKVYGYEAVSDALSLFQLKTQNG